MEGVSLLLKRRPRCEARPGRSEGPTVRCGRRSARRLEPRACLASRSFFLSDTTLPLAPRRRPREVYQDAEDNESGHGLLRPSSAGARKQRPPSSVLLPRSGWTPARTLRPPLVKTASPGTRLVLVDLEQWFLCDSAGGPGGPVVLCLMLPPPCLTVAAHQLGRSTPATGVDTRALRRIAGTTIDGCHTQCGSADGIHNCSSEMVEQRARAEGSRTLVTSPLCRGVDSLTSSS